MFFVLYAEITDVCVLNLNKKLNHQKFCNQFNVYNILNVYLYIYFFIHTYITCVCVCVFMCVFILLKLLKFFLKE